MTALDRRQFLVLAALGPGLLVGCSSQDPRSRGEAPAPQPTDTQPASATLNAWVRVTTNGEVVIAIPRVEMGQGAHTALAQLVAEELEADWASVRVEQAPPGRVYANTALLQAVLPLQPDDDGRLARIGRWSLEQAAVALSLNITGGSTSVRAAWEPMRWAGASARAVLQATAARQWGVSVAACSARHGAVEHADTGRRLSYGELVRLWKDRPLSPPADLSLKPREQWRLIGTSPARLDTRAKSTGQAAFGGDLDLPGLRHAALRTCPYLGGRLVEVDDRAARALSGVREVLRFPDWHTPAVAVVADTTWQALKAAQALQIHWDTGLHTGTHSQAIMQALRDRLDDEGGTAFRTEGQGVAGLAQAERTLEAEYEVPYLAHAPMEMLNATARLLDGRLELWTGTQSPILARWRASQIANLPLEQVTLHIPYLGGGFGRRLEVDIVEQVTQIALQMPGTPVQLQWTRAQDLQHDVYRPPAVARLRAGLRKGTLDALHIRVCAPSLSDGTFKRLFPYPLLADTPPMPDKVQIEGAFDLPYAITHQRVEQVLAHSPLPVGYWRSVGHSYNAFFTECFLDEAAQALNQDPLALRRSLLQGRPRHRAVLDAAARAAEWDTPAPAGRARGLALHECFGAICAQVAEVGLVEGRPRVYRITCALDAGTLVNPDGVKAQLEGAIVFGLSAALWGQVPVADGQVALQGWADYPVVRMADMPEIVCVLIDSHAAPGGVGEPGTPPVAPAVANALARLDGRRRRSLPLQPSHPA